MHKKTLLIFLNYSLFIYVILWTLVPYVRSYTNQGIFRVLFFIIIIMWFITSLLISRKWFNKVLFPSIGISIYILIILAYIIFDYGDLTLIGLVNPMLLVVYIYMGYFYFTTFSSSELKIFVIIAILSFALTSTTSILYLSSNINASRLLTSSSTSESVKVFLERNNVGSFDFIYGSVLLTPIIIKLFLTPFKKSSSLNYTKFLIFKLILTMIIISIVVLIYMSNFSISYILLLASFLISFLPAKKTLSRTIFSSLLILVLTSPFIFYFLTEIFYFIRISTTSQITSSRMDSIISFMKGETTFSELSIRTDLALNSLKSFLNSPIIGRGAYYSDSSIIGSHSQFIDDFGRYGLLGGIPLIIFVGSVFKRIYRSIKKDGLRNTYFFTIIIFLILSVLNPILAYGIMFSIFTIVPIYIKYSDK